MDELAKKRNQAALERYYRLKNGGAMSAPTGTSFSNDVTAVAEVQPKKEKKNKGGPLGGVGYALEELGLGILHTTEGIVDYSLGSVLDIFGADNLAEEMLKTDWIDYSRADKWYNPGKGWEFVGDVTEGVGGMLPSVALSFIPYAGPALSTAAFAVGAAGKSTAEAAKESGELGHKEWLYGTASGAMEAAIEKVTGGIGGTAAGKVLTKQVAKSTLGKVATSFVGEGLEEVASDLLNPLLKRGTRVDKNAQVDWENLPRTFLVGGTTGAVMGGGTQALKAAKAGGFNNLKAIETARELNEGMSDNNIRQAFGKKQIYTQKDIAKSRDRLSASLQRMDENTRAAFLKQNARIAPMFNADGTVKQEVWESRTNSQSIGNLADVSYSASLKGRESTLKYQPVSDVSKVNADVQKAMRNIELLTGGRADVVITADDMLTADGQQANGEYADGVIYVSAKADSYERAMFVMSHELTHTLENTEQYGRLGAFIREQINENSDFAEQYNLDKYRSAYAKAQAGDFSAETLDYQAETEMYADFVAREILGNEDVVRRLVAKERNIAVRFLEWARTALKRLGKNREAQAEYKALKKVEKLLSSALESAKGGVSLEEVEESVQREKALRSALQRTEEVKTEVNSAESETQEVKKETTEEKSVEVDAQSARYSIDEKVFKIGKDSELGERIRKSDKSKYTVIKEYLIEKFGNTVFTLSDGKKAIMDNRDAQELSHKADALRTAELADLKNLVEQAEYIGDPENVEHPKFDAFSYYKIKVAYEGNEFEIIINVGRAKNDKTYHIYAITNYNEKGAVGLLKNNPSRPVGNAIKDGSFDNSIRDNSENVNTSDEKTLKNSSRKSLDVDSEGRELTKEQAEYFKDSKVRDKDGNLLVVYHGTGNEFTVFNNKQKRTRGRLNFGVGFYFSSSRELAEMYIEGDRKRVIEAYIDIKNPYITVVNQFMMDDVQKIREQFSEEERDNIDFSTLSQYLKKLGYDGVIQYNVNALLKGDKKIEIAVSFNSEQIKNIDNKTPTKNPDIRYSIDVEQSEKAKRDSGYVASLRQYVHRLNLTEEIKADIIERCGEKQAKRIFSVWENTTNRTDGVDIVTAHDRLWREGFRTYSTYEEDFLMDMDVTLRGRALKLYEKAAKGKDIALEDVKDILPVAKRERKTASEESVELTNRQTQQVANYTKKKVFTKEDSEIIINELLDGYMNYEDEVGSMRGKTRDEVVQMLWRGMNTHDAGARTGMARKIADYIIQHTVMENVYSDSIVQMHTDTIEALKPYLHKLNLDGMKADLKYHYGDNSPYLRWSKPKGENGIGVDVAAMELNENGFYIEEINPVDIFLRMDEAYRNAVKGVKQTTKKFATEIIGEKEQKALRDDMVKAILRAFDSHGQPSALSDMIREYDKKVRGWKDKYYEERDRNNLTARVLYKVQKLKDFEKGTFANATEFKRDIFKNSIGRLGRIKYRGNLNKSGIRKILAGLLEWYDNQNNPMLEGDVFNEDIAQMLMQLADNAKPLTTAQLEDLANPKEFTSEELKNLEHVIDYFKNFMEKYNKVWRNGKLVEATPIAERYIANMQKNKRAKVGWWPKLFEGYLKPFGDPMAVARYFDKYENGFFSEALEELRQGAIQAQVMEQRLRAPLEEFYRKHKKFLETSEKHTIKYQGESMDAQSAMLLYMTLKREQALRGFAYSGFKFRRGDLTVTVRGFATADNLDMDELRMQAAELQNELAKQFTEAEREYVAIVEKIFNEDCKKAKSETDMARMGYTNINEGYYVPIRRASIAYNVEKQTYRDEVASVSDQSFNKDTVAGARNQLFIDGLTQVAEKHVNGISQYSSLAKALDNYNVLFNLNISGNPNMAISVKSEAENVWREGGKYFSEIIDDIKGVAKTVGVGHEWMGRIRGAYAKYQLGANPKVWVTQFSSFAAAGNILDADCIIGGMGVKVDGKVLDEYCGLAMVRNNENTAAIAQGVLERSTGKLGDFLMKPIGMVDRLVVSRLFGACQLQVQKNGGGNVGTTENLQAAGELLEHVILETQQNAMATEKSAAMRSGSEFVKSFTMFSADSMKLTGRVVDAIGEVAVLRNRIKAETDATVKAALNEKLTAANKQACRAIASIVLQVVFMTAIADGFRWLYNKDDEDENKVKLLVADTFGNMLGGLPVIRDVYSFFSDGYEVESFAYASINDLLVALGDARDVAAAKLAGKNVDDRKMALTVRKVVYAAGQLTGIPTRNIYNVIYGLTNRISPETGYKWNDKFYKSSYRADLAKAIEAGDDNMIATIVGLMLNENVGGVTDSAAREAIDALVVAGFDVIPRSVPDKITYKDTDGESVELELTAKQAKAFEKIYVVANDKVASLVKSSQYKKATQETQAAAINFIYDTYYDMAKCNLTGQSMTKNALFAKAIDIEKLSIIIAEAKTITADKKNGVTVSGSKKAKIVKYINALQLTAVQKYMILGYLGYKSTHGATQVKAYINRLGLSDEEEKVLYAYSGYGE